MSHLCVYWSERERHEAVSLSEQPERLREEGTTVSTVTTPLPAWTGEAMIVPVPNFLQDAWEASPSFADAFVSVYQQITEGYDAAVAEGRIRHDGDVVVDEDDPSIELKQALLRGEGRLGQSALATKYDVCRQTVTRVAGDMGISLQVPRHKAASRALAEQMFRDGETRPRVILAVIAERGLPAVKRNTITQWRLRMEQE